MKRKSIITIFIGLLWSVGVSCQNYFEANGIRYRIIKEADGENAYGTVSVAKAEFGSYEGEIAIPPLVKESNDKYADSYKVVAIDDEAFMEAEYLTKIALPPTIETMGKWAFFGCYGLREVRIPMGNLREIPERAFCGCCELESIVLPSSVRLIGEEAFNGCSALKNIQMPGVKKIGDGAFEYCKSLETVVFPTSLQYFGEWAFAYCPTLRHVELNSSLKSIGEHAFRGCGQLTSIILPEGLRDIGAGAFAHSGITTIKVPEKITVIHQGTFKSSALRQITFPSRLRKIEEYAFPYLLMDTLIVPASVEMDPSALIQTRFGAQRVLEEKVKELKRVKQPYIVSLDADSCYGYYKGLVDDCFIIWNSMYFKTVIRPLEGEQYGVVSLNWVKNEEVSGDVAIPDILEIRQNGHITKFIVGEISMYAFNKCTHIQSIKLPGILPYLPHFSDCSSLQSIDISACEAIHSIPDYMFFGCTELRKLTIPTGIREIGHSAFSQSGLEEIVIPEGIDSIKFSTFQECNLKRITLPSTLKYIGMQAFHGNTSLNSVILPESLTEIDRDAFFKCPLHVIVPENVEIVRSGAFCGAQKVTIKGNPEKWDRNVFGGKIKSIEVSDDRYLSAPALIHYAKFEEGVVISPRTYEQQRQKEEDAKLFASIDKNKKVFNSKDDVLNYLRSHIFLNDFFALQFNVRLTKIISYAFEIDKIEVVSFTQTSAKVNCYVQGWRNPLVYTLQIKDGVVTMTEKFYYETRTYVGKNKDEFNE